MTGGILQGQAFRNVFNLADAPEFEYQDCLLTGKVLVYTTHTHNIAGTKPFTLFKHAVVRHLAPILKKLGQLLPTFSSECFMCLFTVWISTHFSFRAESLCFPL